VRCLGLLLGLCLLFAGAIPQRVDRAHERGADALTAVNPLAKLAVRRHDSARPLGASLQLGPFVTPAVQPHREPPRFALEVLHPTPPARWLDVHLSFDARGPPQAEES
jgi:hypothetical protein